MTLWRYELLLVKPLGKAVEGLAVLDADVAEAGAAERRQEGTAAQGVADVAGQGADVGALAADHANAHLHLHGVERCQFQLVDTHGLGLQFHFPTLAGQLVGTVAVDHHRRVGRGHLLDLANEIGEHAEDEVAGDVARGIGHVDGVLTVERRRGSTQLQGGGVLLVVQLQGLYLLRGLARAEYQYTRRQGVERAGMPRLHPLHVHLLRDEKADVGQGTERRHAVGLVDVYECSFVEVH